MIRPYLAILRDSFRSVVASYVLYVVLALIVLSLLIIAPLSVTESANWQVSWSDLEPPQRIIKHLVEKGSTGKNKRVAYLWDRFPKSLQRELEKSVPKQEDEEPSDENAAKRPAKDDTESELSLSLLTNLTNELNELLAQRDFYDEEIHGLRFSGEKRTLLDRGIDDLSEIELKRFNRLLLDYSLKRNLRPASAIQLDCYYFHWHWSLLTAQLSHHDFSQYIRGYVATYSKWVMSLGILIAILVTSSLIPDMLEPGSINLLLSKPIHRWGLLLTKFFGGCILILLCAFLFFFGFYSWMGIQLGIWDFSILLSVPVYVVVFAMYYSVSVLAGLLFRNSTLSIVFAILLWIACWAVGFAYSTLLGLESNVAERKLLATEHELIMFDVMQTGRHWDGERWTRILDKDQSDDEQAVGFMGMFFDLGNLPDFPGPVYSEDQHRIFTGSGAVASGSTAYEFATGNAQSNWERETRGKLPNHTTNLFLNDTHGLLAVTIDMSVYQYSFSPSGSSDATIVNTTKPADDEKTEEERTTEKEVEVDQPTKKSSSKKKQKPKSLFDKVSDIPAYSLQSASGVDYNAVRQEFACCIAGTVSVFRRNAEHKYVLLHEKSIVELEQKGTMASFVCFRENTLIVGLGNGTIYQLDPSTLETTHSFTVNRHSGIRNMELSPSGQFLGFVFQNDRVQLYDTTTQATISSSLISGQGDVTAICFDPSNRFWTINRFQDTYSYDLSTRTQDRENLVTLSWSSWSLRYVVRPIYRFFPKPGEFYKIVAVLGSDQNAYSPDTDLTKKSQADDPWEPLRSGLVFTAIMLGISCLIFQRRDF